MTNAPIRLRLLLKAFAAVLCFAPVAACFSFSSAWSSAAHIVEHVTAPPPPSFSKLSLDELTNVRIPGPAGSDAEIFAYRAEPTAHGSPEGSGDVVILLHEFFGLNPSIVNKARGLADELGCTVVAPDTFRGDVTDFIPKAIWLALTTPQDRVNDDLDAVCRYLELSPPPDANADGGEEGGGADVGRRRLAVMGFCYGGGKALRYTTERRPDAATVVFYGAPVTDVEVLGKLRAPVCGVFGDRDAQFPAKLLEKFRTALDDAGVENNVRVYEGVGHAFWKDMDEVKRGDQPQTQAYQQATSFLSEFFAAGKK